MIGQPRVALGLLCCALSVVAYAEDPMPSLEELHGRAVANWSAPPFWSSGGTRSSTDVLEKSVTSTVTSPLPFIGISPCRLADTRDATKPPGYGPPALSAGIPRNFTVTGQCGIAAEAAAVSINITAVNTLGTGYILVFPQGGPFAGVSTLNYVAGQTVANAAVVPVGTSGGITVDAGVSGTDLIIDVNGYYANNLTSENGRFSFQSDVTAGTVLNVTNPETASNTGAIAAVSGCGGCTISTTFTYGVVGAGAGDFGFLGVMIGASSYGVFSYGDFGGTGAKYFVEPHPQDASKIIRYVALEGPEAGTYFRGTAETHGGTAVIDVPETFRLVTEQSGLTVQLTPIGELATLAVVGEDLNRIVVQSSRDVRFHYQVNGVRHSYAGFDPVSTSSVFAPAGAEEKMPGYLTDAEKHALIANGTYNADGTVNLDTAHAQGWDRTWSAPPP